MYAGRKIIHIDMDAFYAAIEQRDFPELRGKPVVVGGSPQSRGVVATCSYEARAFGIRSAMPTAQAYRLCPQAIFVPPRFEVYRAVSQQIRRLFLHITPLVEPLSLDEAYLDVSHCRFLQGSASRIAAYLRQEIFTHTQLTASAGVSYNKMLAKIASDLNKPNGMAVILPEDGAAFAAALPVEKFHGIGKITAATMKSLGIYTGADMLAAGEKKLVQHFGKSGIFYHQIAGGNDPRPVQASRERKSIGAETTFAHDLFDRSDILTALSARNREAFAQLEAKNLCARRLSIKLKFSDFTQITRSITISPYFFSAEDAWRNIERLYAQCPQEKAVRLAGVSFAGLIHKDIAIQPDLFTQTMQQ